jgi:electron transport complex protein RnfB
MLGEAAPNDLAHRILAVLPQTQCTRCGFPDCAGYAQALALGQADLNQCPPGGVEGIAQLARIMGLAPKELDPSFGVEAPRMMAYIDEDYCIGCTLCLSACPTDAIVGNNKRMHTVIEAYCTGCTLCLPACPVDCIELENASGEATGWSAWSQEAAATARKRYEFASMRRKRDAQELHARPAKSQVVVQVALEKSRARAKPPAKERFLLPRE